MLTWYSYCTISCTSKWCMKTYMVLCLSSSASVVSLQSASLGSSTMSPHDCDKLSSPWSCGRIMSSSSSDSIHWVGVDVSSGRWMRSHWTSTSVMDVLMLTLTPNAHKKEMLICTVYKIIAHHACYALTLTACCWQNSSLYTLWCCLGIGLAGNWIAALLLSNICILFSARFITPT